MNTTSRKPSARIARLRLQSVITVWTATALAVFGGAWLLGLGATGWQRALCVLPVAALAALDLRGADVVVDVRGALTRTLADLGWVQIPAMVAGGAWLAGITPDALGRAALAAVVAGVAALYRYAPTSPAPAGGTR